MSLHQKLFVLSASILLISLGVATWHLGYKAGRESLKPKPWTPRPRRRTP